MDDISEQTEVANEISEAISTNVGFGDDIDEVCLFVCFSFWLYVFDSYVRCQGHEKDFLVLSQSFEWFFEF